MSDHLSPSLGFDYALLQAVPRVDRGERVNVGALLYCKQADFLAAGIHIDPVRLRALDPGVDLTGVTDALEAIRAICAGESKAGQAGAGTLRSRFGWLTAPRSAVVQAGPVHGGLTADPEAELDRLMNRLVR
ncbi:DUF3037 domain-containing protein (plasmid) [Streptomyces globosus]|uniref:DUF3037 domain-containing protein n=1 Tax=Streptomyces globosus TaxID=68209 RepID=A0A344UBP8_9ACTN|nr:MULTISPECIES: DUF3037 domain-containing protein [Streptomyces]AXE28319.1 DUF3037 domain-containing protein [Streptomyces globosus]